MDPIEIFNQFRDMLGSEWMVGLSLLLAVAAFAQARRFKGQRDAEYQKRLDAEAAKGDAEAGEDDARSDNRALVKEIGERDALIHELREHNLDLRAGILVPVGADQAFAAE